MYDPFAGIKPKRRLVAWRRSRCWKCDNTMTKRHGYWWCPTCVHSITYPSAAKIIGTQQGMT
jgi:hypothetical protein